MASARASRTGHAGQAGHPGTRASATAALFVAALLLVASPAFAHVDLVETSPPSGGEVADPPIEVVLTFSGDLAPDGQPAVRIIDPNGDDLAAADAVLEGRTLRAPLNLAVTPGVHTVDWVIVAGDGDEQRGTFTFTFAPPEEVATPPAASQTTPTPSTAAPSPAVPTDQTPAETASPPTPPEPDVGDEDISDPADAATGTGSEGAASSTELESEVPGGVPPIVAGAVAVLAVAAVALFALRRPDPRTMFGTDDPDDR